MKKAVCPKCEWRLFDVATGSLFVIEIKCPRCKQVLEVKN